MRKLTFVTSLILTGITAAQGQRVAFAGQLLDSSTGRPILRGNVCHAPAPPRGEPALWLCLESDTAGRFRIDTLSPTHHILTFSCWTGQFSGKQLGRTVVDLSTKPPSAVIYRLDAIGCDQRPFDVVTAVFQGHYAYGFEEGRFTPCADSGPVAWVEFSQPPDWARWPTPDSIVVYSRVFVRWHGTMLGPASYGHLGVARFVLKVDSIIEVRTPSTHDCN